MSANSFMEKLSDFLEARDAWHEKKKTARGEDMLYTEYHRYDAAYYALRDELDRITASE